MTGTPAALPDDDHAPAIIVRGSLGRGPTRATVEVVRWFTGWAVLSSLVGLLARITGFERRGEVWCERGALRARRQATFWGKLIRESEEAYPLASIAGVRRHLRYPALRLALAALAFGSATFTGSVLFLEALRGGTAELASIAAGVIALGAGLDLVLRAWLPGARGRVAVEIDLLPRKGIRLRDVDAKTAGAFVADLAHRVERR